MNLATVSIFLAALFAFACIGLEDDAMTLCQQTRSATTCHHLLQR